jgi:NAD(P)H-dependent FMN reductase
MLKIKIIAGSTRPGRFNIQPARWITEIAKARKDIEVELLDLEEINLPFLDEAAPPMMQTYSKEHTKKWAAKIADADGFIFVTPEYNHSTSAALKNAIDFLYAEWNFKPVTFVSYGSLAGGSRAVEHLRGIAAEIKMYDLREQIMLPNYWENLNEKGEYQFNERHRKSAEEMLKSLIFWAKKMKDARSELAG